MKERFDRRPCAAVVEHSPSLGFDALSCHELIRRGEIEKSIVGKRSPEERSEAVGDLVRSGTRGRSVTSELGTEKKVRGGKECGDQRLHSSVCIRLRGDCAVQLDETFDLPRARGRR